MAANKFSRLRVTMFVLLIIIAALSLYFMWGMYRLGRLFEATPVTTPLVVDSVTNWPSEPIGGANIVGPTNVAPVKSRSAWTLDGSDCGAIEVDVIVKKVTVVCK